MKTVRMVFAKTGRACYISHLDLTRVMSRAMRRAQIPVWYTEGFNRHPYITFAAPLSLGYEGLEETMDFRLEEDMAFAEVVERMNGAMPEGLTAVSAAEAEKKVKDLAAGRYRLTTGYPAGQVKALLSRPEIPVEKRTKQKTVKTVDIRPAFADAAVEDTEDGSVISVVLPLGNDTVNPALLRSALEADSGEEKRFQVTRLALLDTDGKPFR